VIEKSESEQGTEISVGEWRSPIIRGEDGCVTGVMLFFTPGDLELLDVNTESAEEVGYGITENGLVQLKERDRTTIISE